MHIANILMVLCTCVHFKMTCSYGTTTGFHILTCVAYQCRQRIWEETVRCVQAHVRVRILIALCSCSPTPVIPSKAAVVEHDVTSPCPIITRHDQLETRFLFDRHKTNKLESYIENNNVELLPLITYSYYQNTCDTPKVCLGALPNLDWMRHRNISHRYYIILQRLPDGVTLN